MTIELLADKIDFLRSRSDKSFELYKLHRANAGKYGYVLHAAFQDLATCYRLALIDLVAMNRVTANTIIFGTTSDLVNAVPDKYKEYDWYDYVHKNRKFLYDCESASILYEHFEGTRPMYEAAAAVFDDLLELLHSERRTYRKRINEIADIIKRENIPIDPEKAEELYVKLTEDQLHASVIIDSIRKAAEKYRR